MRTAIRMWILLGSALLPHVVAAEEPEEIPPDHSASSCGDAMYWGQRLRDEERLMEALGAFEACAARTCLDVVQRRCAGWLAETREAIPMVRLEITGATSYEQRFAQVFVDGVLRPGAGPGLPIPTDPGRHRFEVLLPEGRRAGTEVVVDAGEQTVTIEMAPPVETFPAAEDLFRSSPAPPPAARDEEASLKDPVDLGFALTVTGFTVGGAAAVASVVTGALALERFGPLADRCEQGQCTEAEIATGRRLGDASTGMAVVAVLGAAVGVVGLLLPTDDDTAVVAGIDGLQLRF